MKKSLFLGQSYLQLVRKKGKASTFGAKLGPPIPQDRNICDWLVELNDRIRCLSFERN